MILRAWPPVVLALLLCCAGAALAAPEPDAAEARSDADARLRGHVEAWLLYVAGVAPPGRVTVAVQDGVVTLDGTLDSVEAIDRVTDGIAALVGVRQVVGRLRVGEAPGAPRPSARRSRWDSWLEWLAPAEGRRMIRFPVGDLFTPPLADQKQPRFHTTWQRYDLGFGTFDIGSVGFGENFGLLRAPGAAEGDGWQLGVSGAVLAIFNLDADSHDLLNADYYIGFPWSWRGGPWSARARVFHLSSHLGDEFLLNPQPGPPVERINLSYEALELLGSRERQRLRAYFGGVRILSSDTPLGRDRAQLGLEYRGSPVRWPTSRFVAGIDLQSWEETDWDVDLSMKVGLRFRSPYGGPRGVLFLLEYYDGHVPHGQFYPLEVRYLGFGIAYAL